MTKITYDGPDNLPKFEEDEIPRIMTLYGLNREDATIVNKLSDIATDVLVLATTAGLIDRSIGVHIASHFDVLSNTVYNDKTFNRPAKITNVVSDEAVTEVYGVSPRVAELLNNQAYIIGVGIAEGELEGLYGLDVSETLLGAVNRGMAKAFPVVKE